MIECVFTLDYELFGDGSGGLQKVVHEPAELLARAFQHYGAPLVVFVEATELARIDQYGADPAIELVKQQIRNMACVGFEIGLHIHPWWSNARREDQKWILDYGEYSLTTLAQARIAEILSEAIGYLRRLLGPDYTPLSFRAGNWLFQPSEPTASLLARHGIRIDSSVFRGGRLHNYNLDYRRLPKRRYFWRFGHEVTAADPEGHLIEVPIHTATMPFWCTRPARRLAAGNAFRLQGSTLLGTWNRIRDFLRLQYPLKLDFCRLSAEQMIAMMSPILEVENKMPSIYRPIVAIGHTKDLSNIDAVYSFLQFLRANGISIRTFQEILPTLNREEPPICSVRVCS